MVGWRPTPPEAGTRREWRRRLGGAGGAVREGAAQLAARRTRGRDGGPAGDMERSEPGEGQGPLAGTRDGRVRGPGGAQRRLRRPHGRQLLQGRFALPRVAGREGGL